MPWHGRSMPPHGWRNMQYELSVQFYMGIISRNSRKVLELQKAAPGGMFDGRAAICLVMSALYGHRVSRYLCPGKEHSAATRMHRRGAASGPATWRSTTVCFSAPGVAGLMSPGSPQQLQDDVLWEYGQGGPGVFTTGTARSLRLLHAVAPTFVEGHLSLVRFFQASTITRRRRSWPSKRRKQLGGRVSLA